MNKEDKKFCLELACTVIAILSFLVASAIQFTSSMKTVVIEDKVIDVDMSHDKYMTVTFEKKGTYNIAYDYYSSEIDFTVNSVMKIKLTYSSYFLMPNTDEIWGIVQIVKVPD